MKKIKAKFPNVRILVADDYSLNQELLQEMLEMMDCHIDIACDGEEAVRLYQQNTYDLIFMDVQMPKMDGYDATQEIRNIEQHKTYIPIIAITANAMIEDKEKCLSVGMTDYISKPIKGEYIEALLEKYLPGKKA